MFIDTHAHLDFESFDDDRDAVIQRAIENEVDYIITIGTNLETSKKSVKIADNYAAIYAAVGIHPSDCSGAEEKDFNEIKSLATAEKVVAIGEIGLDYYRMYSDKPTQIEAFKNQLNMAAKLNLPVIVHNREAHDDMLEILLEEKTAMGVMHSFSGSMDFLKAILEKTNFFISFTGGVTFKNTRGAEELIAHVPLERLLLETDSPFITPVPHRGKRNEPAFILHTARKIAEIKGVPLKELADATTENAHQLFMVNV